ncbi:MAG: glycosyltransferase family 39 protein [Cyclobacteriaceae bacterium]
MGIRSLFYTLWLASLLIQAYYVELRGDEAYYWRYSKELAWGYFDHPPVTAVLVKAGDLLFHNELGVRLFFVLLCTATIWVMEKMIQPANLKLFYAIVSSIAFLQLGMVFGGGMFAIPDFPLLFLTALFFYLYKQYLQNSSWTVFLLLAVVICLLMLSKYHGILVIGFTIVSNLALLKRKSFWGIALLALILFMPHVLWQVANDFPSMKYHFYERSSKGYSFSFTTEYLLAQPFVLGPFIGVVLIYLGFTFRPNDVFERSLKFMIVGTYLFFFLMTFKGRVEGNWTIITFVPLLYIGYNYIEKSKKLTKFAFYSFAGSLVLILVVRIALITNFPPASIGLSNMLGARRWVKELKEVAKDRPVAFMNSYQRASLYEFYSGVPSFSLNNVWGRKNQYTIWDTEAKYQGRSIVLVANIIEPGKDSIQFLKDYYTYTLIDNFRSYSNLSIESDLKSPVKSKPSDTLRLNLKFKYWNPSQRDLEANPEYPSQVIYSFFQYANSQQMRGSGLILKNEMVNNNLEYPLLIIAPANPGQYDFYLSVGTSWLPPSISSDKVTFIVE